VDVTVTYVGVQTVRFISSQHDRCTTPEKKADKIIYLSCGRNETEIPLLGHTKPAIIACREAETEVLLSVPLIVIFDAILVGGLRISQVTPKNYVSFQSFEISGVCDQCRDEFLDYRVTSWI
jgi:hypothetical protein